MGTDVVVLRIPWSEVVRERLGFNLKRTSIGAGRMLMSLRGRVHLGFSCAQHYDPLLSFSKGLYLHKALAVELHNRFWLAFSGVMMDGS